MQQVFKFIVVGGGNTCLSFAAFSFLVHVLPPDPLMIGASQIASYICGTITSYILNNFWVFRDRNAHRETLPKFILAQTGLMLLSATLIATLSVRLPVKPEYIWVMTMTLITAINFTVMKKWVFKS